ncbi:MAG: excinuclease ABC subunit UvrA [Roseburia sp.]|nr:excinuclease ABC subunit UvrA [Anaeroplasma bactoclasticum]MCM1195627.1 excinuclease ABC subunit UvrA [Roseburia sp.]MCM1556628.1 excinuclease ABC subunit UvrA [Anaeroplasma bactoclasticum]
MDYITIKGARENNLKNVSIELPKNKFIVMTGLSGSGKSSLAFDTIYQEGQRRFVESLSSYARQFIGSMDKPDVDSIEGLSPAISIDQKSASHNPRSTVGTVTEIYDYLRVLFARIGTPYCPTHHIPISSFSNEQIVNKILELPEGTKIFITSPVVFREKGEHKAVFTKYLQEGFVRAIVDGETIELDQPISLEKTKKHTIEIVVERLILKEGVRSRIAEAVELAVKYSKGYVQVYSNNEPTFYSTVHACPECGYSLATLEPRIFSFNNPLGACPDCNGLGKKLTVSPDLVIDEDKSLEKGCIVPYRNQDKENLNNAMLEQTCSYYNIDMKKPFKDLTEEQKKVILYGSKDLISFKLRSTSGRIHDKRDYFEGIITNFQRRYVETNSDWIRDWIESYMVEHQCSSCKGARLNPSILNIYIDDKNIYDVCSMPIDELYDWFKGLSLSEEKQVISKLAIKEICDRLTFLKNVGLEYLTLSRSAETLSGGEAQRIRLATQIGSRLTGVLYVLDEPSIGLHQRDNARLIKTLKEMRDLGNTLIVVEHDDETMKACDYLLDIGPKAGVHGGEVVAKGTPQEVMESPNSITGAYLSGRMKIEVPETRRKGNKKFIKIVGAKENNLKNINVTFPLGVITCVTGVSGSGKSTLVNEVLYKNAYVKLYSAKKVSPGEVKKIEGLENIDRIVHISQQPIGRTPRSNPATYTGVFDDIRDLFSQTTDAKIKGYDKSRFSFNVRGGRCEACSGDGVKRISMHFLPDVFVPCEVCHGTRYQQETLDVKFKGKNIADVLDMTVEDAVEFFDAFPKIRAKLQTIYDVGLGYIKLGQSSTTLSGGEAQRVKLAYELHSKISPKSLYILDEPTTGLHVDDIKRLMEVISRIADAGATVIIIEHNLDVIKLADYIIDLGPEGGNRGGTVQFEGTPEELVKTCNSYTAQYLRPLLK